MICVLGDNWQLQYVNRSFKGHLKVKCQGHTHEFITIKSYDHGLHVHCTYTLLQV